MNFRTWYLIVLVMWLPYGNNFETFYPEIEEWTTHFGQHLWKLNEAITFSKEIKDKYASVTIEDINEDELVKEIAADIQKFLRLKVEAVKRIADTAENAAKDYQYDPNIKVNITSDLFEEHLRYPNAKYLNETIWPLEEDEYFNTAISLDFSTIQVDTNVHDQSPTILNGIEATKVLDSVFNNNYKSDPTLYWQYFGSAKGYLRNFPGIKWPTPFSLQTEDEFPADVYDNRMRPWFIEAATSPKDIIILFDISGSMLGLRYAIAKYVIENILDSLTQNDFVGVFKFSSDIENVVPCFNRTLVPAYGENLYFIKQNIGGIDVINKTNFSLALTFAFELLQEYNFSRESSRCNQAIMIVADGAAETNEEVFKKYNPDQQIRVFTYLIGREVTEFEEMVWMACNQRGYYTHITGDSQVPDQVEKYIPVMARPLAFNRVHPIIWTPLYSDITNERDMYTQEDMDKCELLTTVAMPAYNQSTVELTVTEGNITRIEKIQKDELLGVAGVDVPIKQIRKLIPFYKIGVNGYSFMLTDHGHILFHPYLQPYYKILLNAFHLNAGIETKPLYNTMLKIGYSNVDITDVEFGVTDVFPWERDSEIMELREEMIQRNTNSLSIKVKINYDHQKRVMLRTNSYFYTPIDTTPFSLGVVLPYDKARIKSTDINSLNLTVISLLEDNNKWSIHPNWVYCEDKSSKTFSSTPENNLLKCLKHINEHRDEFLKNKTLRVKNHFQWNKITSDAPNVAEKSETIYLCDRDLMLNLIFDVAATAPLASDNLKDIEIENARSFGVSKIFIATHSGFTRWIDMEESDHAYTFITDRAIEEDWYKRAVDYNLEEEDTYVFSVPFDALNYSETYITASRAIFVKNGDKTIPAAVVGVRFDRFVFTDLVFNSTVGFDCDIQQCDKPCSNMDVSCYLIDENGYVIVSENEDDTGLFFGGMEGQIMRVLIDEGIYESVNMYDHQATCGKSGKTNAAPFLTSPFNYISSASSWFLKKFAQLWLQYNLFALWDSSWLSSLAHDKHFHHAKQKIDVNSTEPCTTNFTLYTLNKFALKTKPIVLNITNCVLTGCDKHFMIQKIPFTNLIMVAADSNCSCSEKNFDDTVPSKVEIGQFNMTECDMLKLDLHTHPSRMCYSYHINEMKIRDCGIGCNLQAFFGLIMINAIVLLISLK